MKKNRVFSFAVILLAYLVAFIGGALVWHYLGLYLANIRNDNLFSYYILLFLVSDVVATIIIWIFSTIFNNASIYDPYWSVLPMVMVVVFAKDLANFAPHTWIMIALVEVWGLRLTINWALSFKNLTIQDFRYDHYKQKFSKLWPLVNLFGIHLFPTLVVFLGMLSVIAYMQATPIFNLATFMSIALCIAAIAIEMVADIQMKQARKKPHHGLIITGLWKRLLLSPKLYHISKVKARSFYQQAENRISWIDVCRISMPLYLGLSQSCMASLGRITGIRL